MNEQIKQLAVQAGATLEKGYIELSDGQLMLSDNVDLDKSNMDLEKFAELIVRECAEICRRQQYYDADDEHKRGVNSGSYTCMNAIKQQFGVE